jgi:hypothetical protein
VAEAEWNDYLGAGEAPGGYRVPMLLLAVTSAFPALARPWLLWLVEKHPAQWVLAEKNVQALADKHADTTDVADWQRLASTMGKLGLQGWPDPVAEVLDLWVPRVARYSF